MKPPTAYTDSIRYSPAQNLVWLLRLADASGSWRSASRTIQFDGEDYPARIAAPPDWKMESHNDFGVGGLIGTIAHVRLLNIGDESEDAGPSLSEWLATRQPFGLQATLKLLWRDENETWTEADAVTLLSGVVTEVQRSPLELALTLRDRLTALAEKRIGRILTPAMTGGESSPLIGQTLPIVFGRHENLPLLELRPGVRGKLAEPLAPEDPVISLVSVSSFPESGTVQVDAEPIQYLAIDVVLNTLGTPDHPIVRSGTPAPHSRGADARFVPEGGFQWLVADHPCAAVKAVRADGMALPPDLWDAELRELGGISAQIISMESWPVVAGEQARSVTARVEGWPDDAGDTIENPADVLKLLLTNPRFAILPEEMLDGASLNAARELLTSAGYFFARRIAGGAALGELIDGAAREAALWVRSGASAVSFAPRGIGPEVSGAVERLDEAKALNAMAGDLWRPGAGAAISERLELVAENPQSGGAPSVWGRGTEDDPESNAAGRIPIRLRLKWLTGASETALVHLGERLWGALREMFRIHEQSFPPGAALLEPGDSVLLDRPVLDLNDAPAWVEAVAMEGTRARITLRLPEAGEVCWIHDDATFLRSFGFGSRLTLYIAGHPVLSLLEGGHLRLAGVLREDAGFEHEPFGDPIVYSDGFVYLSAGAEGARIPFMRVDAVGNVDLNGAVIEESELDYESGGECHGAETGRFWMNLPEGRGAMEFRADAGSLHLQGKLIEGAEI